MPDRGVFSSLKRKLTARRRVAPLYLHACQALLTPARIECQSIPFEKRWLLLRRASAEPEHSKPNRCEALLVDAATRSDEPVYANPG